MKLFPVIIVSSLAVLLLSCNSEGPSRQTTVHDIDREENLLLRESPFLQDRITSAELPPLDERIPEDPRIVQTVESLGIYGGTWRRYHIKSDFPSFRLINNYWGLTRWDENTENIIPGISSSWEFNEDGTEITYTLRKGVNWSDGDPFDSEDIAFWWSVATDDRTAEVPPEWAYSGGERMELETPDPWTVVFRYKEPFYTHPAAMATGFWTPEILIRPSHFLKQFHPDHSDYEDFTEFDKMFGDLLIPERPTLGAWMMTFKSNTGDQIVFERNPFYWCVDPDGRQLPYIDRIESTRVQSPETGILMIMSGLVDAQFRYVSRQDFGLLKQFSEKNDYTIKRWEEGTGALFAIIINMEHIDEERAALLSNQDFREGLAFAVDRELLNQVMWNGLSEPRGATITDEAWHLQSERGKELLERWKNAWSEFDPEKAEEKLDQAGLTERDSRGMRMYNGQPLSLVIDVYDWPLAMDQAMMLEEMFENVGLNILVQRDIGGRRDRRIREAEFDIYIQHMSEMDLFTFPGYVFPVVPFHWHPQSGNWYATGGEKGREPTGWTKELGDLYDRTKSTADLEERHALVLEAIEIQLEHGPFIIGTTGRQFSPIVISNSFKNVPESGIIGPWATMAPASKNPEQFYIDQSGQSNQSANNFDNTNKLFRSAEVLSDQ